MDNDNAKTRYVAACFTISLVLMAPPGERVATSSVVACKLCQAACVESLEAAFYRSLSYRRLPAVPKSYPSWA